MLWLCRKTLKSERSSSCNVSPALSSGAGRALLLSVAISLSSSGYACGPDFPLRLLENRSLTMAEMPESNFKFEAQHLLKPQSGLPIAEGTYDFTSNDPESITKARDEVEQKGLSPAQRTLVLQLRSLSPSEIIATTGISAELRLYLAGAAAFKQGDDAAAQGYFQQVLALPANAQTQHTLWALYSLGRSQARQGDQAAAALSFQQVRARVIAGAPDDLNLALASLGEEARLYKNDQNWGKAVQLYAAQAAQGDASGITSLQFVARGLMALPSEQLQPLLSDVLIERLLTVWLLSNFSEYGYKQPVFGNLNPAQRLYYQQVVQVLAQAKNIQPVQAERLAALMYQNGDYDSAKRMLPAAGNGGLAWWVRAKIALREGKLDDARAAYAKAAAAFPKNEAWGDRRREDWNSESLNPHCRVQGESAILALKQGDYVEAFDQMWQGQDIYWQDAADIAERVLTLDELQQYVDKHVPAPAAKPQPPSGSSADQVNTQLSLPAKLRELLGRRMLREEHYSGAAAYFSPALKPIAEDYISARQTAASHWHFKSTRAEAYYHAATIARSHGLELLGYENSPDYSIWGGSFSQEDILTKPDSWLGADERKRLQASLAQPNLRWHYRQTAAELANQAADLVPRRSQAFAATLCQATGWVSELDPKLMQHYYQRYLQQGAYVPWGSAFGSTCPAPDFNGSTRYGHYLWLDLKHQLRPHKTAVYASTATFVLLLLGIIGLLLRRYQKPPSE